MKTYRAGIDIGSTTVKLVVLDEHNEIIFGDYRRHHAHTQETLNSLLKSARQKIGDCTLKAKITGSGSINLGKALDIAFVQEVVAVATALKSVAPQTDVAIELGGEDAKIIYFKGGLEERMNGVCAGGTGSFIDQMAALLQTDATGLNDAAKDYKQIYPIAARCGVFAKADAYVQIMSIPSDDQLDSMVEQAMNGVTREYMEQTMLEAMTAQTGMNSDEMADYITAMTDEDITELYTQMVTEGVKQQYAAGVQSQMAGMQPVQLAAALDMELENYTAEQCANYYDEILEFSDSSCENNLLTLGYLDLDSPATVNLYAATFESKDIIEDAIANYNEGMDELSQIHYTDYVGLMMSSVTAIINAITYVLIAFVAVSLVVSSIMIGVITLISVQERTKEIGVLRAIGASKKNVSNLFNAETIIIGFASGTLGVLITKLLCIPINAILHHFTGIAGLNAYLPWQMALVLIGISVVLTMFAGLIPSRSAAKKDPVVALRSE